jgi:kumamolisin
MYQAGLRGCVTNERRHGRTVKVPTRAMPDLSMLADGSPGYAIFCPERLCGSSNPWQEVGGTSAAAPLLAGGLALVDQSLRATDRKPLGAAGPLMYEVAKAPGPRAFHDVTRGNNDIAPFLPGARHRGVGCCSAHSGYDLATGLGSIDLARFAQIVAIVRSVS